MTETSLLCYRFVTTFSWEYFIQLGMRIWHVNCISGTRKKVVMPQESKFSLKNLSKTFGSGERKTIALDNIDLEIEDGEFLCLLGESGCGKSTLLKIMAGFEKETSGEILFDGKPITGPGHERGFVFQQYSLLPWLNVRKNISLGQRIRGCESKESVKELIELFGLTGFEKHYPSQLSGGMSQRVAIARTLANDSKVLMLDEPFGALDAFTRIRLQDELINLWRKNNLTTVFVTHDIDEAVFLATRIVVLTPRPGRIARVFNVGLNRPRNRSSPEFYRLRAMISEEFAGLASQPA